MQSDAELALAILRKMVEDRGYFDEEVGVIDVRVDLTDEEQALVRRLREH